MNQLEKFDLGQIISWQDLRNPWLYTFKAKMLNDGGYVRPINCILKGDSTRHGAKSQLRLVRFDRRFVIAKLAYELKNLGDFERVQDVVQTALDMVLLTEASDDPTPSELESEQAVS